MRKWLRGVAEKEGVPYVWLPMVRGISPFLDLASIFLMVLRLLWQRPDIVHSYTPKAGLVAMTAAWIVRVPFRVHTFTGLIFPSRTGLQRRLLVAVDRWICYCATEVIPESKGVRDDLLSARITRKTLRTVGAGNIAGVDTQRFSSEDREVRHAAASVRDEHGLDSGFSFCYVGRLNRDKGIDELVSAFLALPGDPILVLVGALDATNPPASSTLSLIESEQRIRAVGFQDDIRPWLAACDALVLPSHREGFPNVVLQAMSMSRPVISTEVSGASEVVTPGVTGWLVPVKDVQELAQAMQSAMAWGHDGLEQMGVAARELMKSRYEQAVHRQVLRQFYAEVSGSWPSARSTS